MNDKGFTLVEVIVVLAIIALIATMTVPKLTGWIDVSKEKAAIVEAQLVRSAFQRVISERAESSLLNEPEKISVNREFIDDLNSLLDDKMKLYMTGENMNFDGDNQPEGEVVFSIDIKKKTVPAFWYKASNGVWVMYDPSTDLYTSNVSQSALLPSNAEVSP